jgi:hypothetical protein
MTDIHHDTIMRLLVKVGNTCEKIMDQAMQNLTCKDIEVNELWSFVGKKQRHVRLDDDPGKVGDFYTFVAIDSETKLVPTYKVRKRDLATLSIFRIPGLFPPFPRKKWKNEKKLVRELKGTGRC